MLHLPSHLGNDWCNSNAARELANAELSLREGQLNDSLKSIHIALGHKAYWFRNDVCSACSQRLKLCAWAEVQTAESTVQHNAWVYMHAQQAIVDLGATDSLLDWYKVLTQQDLKVQTSVIARFVDSRINHWLGFGQWM